MDFSTNTVDFNTMSGMGGGSLTGGGGASGSTVNIRDIDDPFERYQMPTLESRVKNLGQYNQTHITNLPAIAAALKVPLTCLVKFYGANLSTQAKFNKDTGELCMKGPFTHEQLFAALRIFINQYVLCTKCNLPELKYEPHKKKQLKITCQACGKVVGGDLSDRIYKCFK